VHFLLPWLESRFLDKDLFVASANALLAWVAFGVFQKWKASVLIAVLLVFTNYYLIAMYFSAERLSLDLYFWSCHFYISKK
jgi:hypothetical protein